MKSPVRSLILSVALAAFSPASSAKPLKVFILAGQSNMQGHAHDRTLEHVGMDPTTAPMLRAIVDASGQPKVHEQIRISYLSKDGVKAGPLTVGFGANDEKIGPELTFGIYAQRLLDEPILIIKAAWGGKSLHTDFRTPSAGPYEFTSRQLDAFKRQRKDLAEMQAAKTEATGQFYRLMLEHVRNVLAENAGGEGIELAGFVWFQGWNDMVDSGVYPKRNQPGGYDNYSRLLAQLIRDVRRDLKAPGLPFVIGVMGAGGPVKEYPPGQNRYAGVHQNFRNAMAAPAALPEFAGNVSAVWTEKYWDPELTRLTARDAKVQQAFKKIRKEQRLNREQAQAALAKLRAEEFKPQELEVLTKGVSNAQFHYLGSAKILGGIGKGFAEAMINLLKK